MSEQNRHITESAESITRLDVDLASSLLDRVQRGERPPSESRLEVIRFLREDQCFSNLSEDEIAIWGEKMLAFFEQHGKEN